jgi:hypothetical protein
MTTGKTTNSLPFLNHDGPTPEQLALDVESRRRMARHVLEIAVDARDLVLLAGSLGVEPELDELCGNDPERQQRLADARSRLVLPPTVG